MVFTLNSLLTHPPRPSASCCAVIATLHSLRIPSLLLFTYCTLFASLHSLYSLHPSRFSSLILPLRHSAAYCLLRFAAAAPLHRLLCYCAASPLATCYTPPPIAPLHRLLCYCAASLLRRLLPSAAYCTATLLVALLASLHRCTTALLRRCIAMYD